MLCLLMNIEINACLHHIIKIDSIMHVFNFVMYKHIYSSFRYDVLLLYFNMGKLFWKF